MTRHILTFGLAAASLLAAPLAFAQDAHANANAADHAQAEHTQQSTGMQDHANMQPATPAVPATPATPADPQQDTQAVPATPATPAEPAKKVTWSELDADHDGALSKTEAAPVDSLSTAFDSADADKDGVLIADEYKAYRSTTQESPTSQP
jgi:hypothetical protein